MTGNNFFLNLSVSIPGFLLGIVLHEAAHAYVAKRFGDSTAEREGRLSLNPLVHYDMIGTVLFPMVGAVLGGIIFGWAKPVPVDPRNFKNFRKGVFWVSFAGPLANLLLAVVFCLFYVIFLVYIPENFFFYKQFLYMLDRGILINMVLAVFNLIPFPPLDGSKMVTSFLDYDAARKYESLQNFSFLFIVILWTTNIFTYLMAPALWFTGVMKSLFLITLG